MKGLKTARASDVAAPAPASQLIVYVDGDGGAREAFERGFGARFQVRTCATAAATLELLRAQAAALVLTEQQLGDGSGHALLCEVQRAQPEAIRMAVATYGALDPVLADVHRGLVARVVMKPWQAAELEELLRWGLATFELGRHQGAVQRRLLQTERLTSLGSMTGAVLHDLHQPLTNLTVNLERLAELGKTSERLEALLAGAALSKKDKAALHDLASELPELARDLMLSCRLMTDITGGLKHFLKAEAHAPPAGVDPVPVIKYAMNVCREAAVRARGRIVYEGPKELPKLRIGSTELTQVLINVVANGAQALLERDKLGGRVVVSAGDDGGWLRFGVEDNGPGMTADVLAKVGTPFFSTRREGTGLGVAQCRRLVEGAGGTFRIASVEGQGTSVTFSIPKV